VHLCSQHDLIPEVEILEAALDASRRVNSFGTAVRILEGVREKVCKIQKLPQCSRLRFVFGTILLHKEASRIVSIHIGSMCDGSALSANASFYRGRMTSYSLSIKEFGFKIYAVMYLHVSLAVLAGGEEGRLRDHCAAASANAGQARHQHP
jgi:hypothetical protein